MAGLFLLPLIKILIATPYEGTVDFGMALEAQRTHSAAYPRTILERIGMWLWPSYIVAYPLIFIPGRDYTLNSSYAARLGLSLFVLLIGAAVEWAARPKARPMDIPVFLRQHPAVAVAVGFGVWTLAASTFSVMPAISLTGSLNGNDDGAIWYFVLSLIFVVVYLYCLRVPGAFRRLCIAVVVSGSITAVLGLIEVLAGKALIAPSFRVPVVTFLSPGHLASLFVLCLGVALGLWYKRKPWALAGVALLALGLGLTVNRTALIVTALLLLVGLRRPGRSLVAALIVAAGIGSGFLVSDAAPPSTTQGQRDLSDSASLGTRQYLWESALGGIAARPVTGWGGGNVFSSAWYRFLPFEDLERYLQLEFGFLGLRDVIDDSGILPLYVIEEPDGQSRFFTLSKLRVHNQFLDMAVMWGLVGLLLYLALFIIAFRNALSLQPAALGIFGVHAFFMLWFSTVHLEGVLWVAWALACLPQVRSSLGQQSAQRSPEPALPHLR